MQSQDMRRPAEKGLFWAVLLSACLACAKLGAFWFSGSLIVLTSALDSFADAVISFVNLRIARLALARPDSQHPFGHGGFEVVGGLVQGVFIMMAGLQLGLESIRELLDTSDLAMRSEYLLPSAWVLVGSAVGGAVIQAILASYLKGSDSAKERSLALEADSAHYLADVGLNLSAAAGLFVIWHWELYGVDAFFGVVGGLFLLRTSFPVLRKCYKDIVHNEASPALQQKIVDTVLQSDPRVKGIHQLRSRELGPHLFVDFHLKLPRNLSLEEAHRIGDSVTRKIKETIPRSDVIAHLDPDSEPDQKEWEPSYTLPDDK